MLHLLQAVESLATHQARRPKAPPPQLTIADKCTRTGAARSVVDERMEPIHFLFMLTLVRLDEGGQLDLLAENTPAWLSFANIMDCYWGHALAIWAMSHQARGEVLSREFWVSVISLRVLVGASRGRYSDNA